MKSEWVLGSSITPRISTANSLIVLEEDRLPDPPHPDFDLVQKEECLSVIGKSNDDTKDQKDSTQDHTRSAHVSSLVTLLPSLPRTFPYLEMTNSTDSLSLVE